MLGDWWLGLRTVRYVCRYHVGKKGPGRWKQSTWKSPVRHPPSPEVRITSQRAKKALNGRETHARHTVAHTHPNCARTLSPLLSLSLHLSSPRSHDVTCLVCTSILEKAMNGRLPPLFCLGLFQIPRLHGRTRQLITHVGMICLASDVTWRAEASDTEGGKGVGWNSICVLTGHIRRQAVQARRLVWPMDNSPIEPLPSISAGLCFFCLALPTSLGEPEERFISQHSSHFGSLCLLSVQGWLGSLARPHADMGS